MACWDFLGASWILFVFWGFSGHFLGTSAVFSAVLGASWGFLGASCGLRAFHFLGSCLGIQGLGVCSFGAFWGFLGLPWIPRVWRVSVGLWGHAWASCGFLRPSPQQPLGNPRQPQQSATFQLVILMGRRCTASLRHSVNLWGHLHMWSSMCRGMCWCTRGGTPSVRPQEVSALSGPAACSNACP